MISKNESKKIHLTLTQRNHNILLQLIQIFRVNYPATYCIEEKTKLGNGMASTFRKYRMYNYQH